MRLFKAKLGPKSSVEAALRDRGSEARKSDGKRVSTSVIDSGNVSINKGRDFRFSRRLFSPGPVNVFYIIADSCNLRGYCASIFALV